MEQEKENIWIVFTKNLDNLTKEFAFENSQRHKTNGLVFMHCKTEIIEEKIKFLCELVTQTKYKKEDYEKIFELVQILKNEKIRSRITKKIYKNYIIPVLKDIRMNIANDNHIFIMVK